MLSEDCSVCYLYLAWRIPSSRKAVTTNKKCFMGGLSTEIFFF